MQENLDWLKASKLVFDFSIIIYLGLNSKMDKINKGLFEYILISHSK